MTSFQGIGAGLGLVSLIVVVPVGVLLGYRKRAFAQMHRAERAEAELQRQRANVRDLAAQLIDARASLAIYRAPVERVRSIMHDLKHGFRDEELPDWFIVGTQSNPILTPFNDSARYSEVSEFYGTAGTPGERK